MINTELLPGHDLRIDMLRISAVHNDQVVVASDWVAEHFLGALGTLAYRGRFPIDPLAGCDQSLVSTVCLMEYEQNLVPSVAGEQLTTIRRVGY